MEKRWWVVEMLQAGQRKFVGRVEATRAEIIKACGPWCTVEDNGLVTVYGRPI
jgi:hypothetical protein